MFHASCTHHFYSSHIPTRSSYDVPQNRRINGDASEDCSNGQNIHSSNFEIELINIQRCLGTLEIQSPEEASKLLAEALEHERQSHLLKTLTNWQLEKAQEEAHSAEVQLKSAEDYMCAILHTIRSHGFSVKFIDAHTAAVANIDNSGFLRILYQVYQPLMQFRHLYCLSFRHFIRLFVA